ncbi:hypothetical protein [Barnesiella intestinihominis]|uniref:hypothetical protein n=1 Tax=Barnesiella intestinihominis TaxID=487174 RepID=UPI003AF0539D
MCIFSVFLFLFGESGERRSGLTVLAAICRQKVTVQALTPIDRNTPVGNAEHRQPASPYGMASGTLPVTIRLNAVCPCSGTHCLIWTFTTAPPPTAC